ncbi:MAG: FIST N-terminal domain-containing protein [Candidatus Eisenbacteria bacterium]
MPTTSGVGRSNRPDATQAGREAALAACEALHGVAPHLLLVFATSGYPMHALLAGIREVAPDASVSGCSGEGIIAQGRSDEVERTVGVLALHSDSLRFTPLLAKHYAELPGEAGADLARQVTAVAREDSFALFVFPDGLTGNCSEMLATLQPGIPPHITIAGGTAGDALTFERTWQFCDGEVAHGAVSALLVSGNGRLDVAVSHGCVPIGLERRVTSAEGGWVREIDGEPAWAVFRQYLDGNPEDLNTEGAIHLSVGEPLPEGAAADYEPYIIRTPMGLDKETGALFFPGGGLTAGGAMRLTRRDPLRVRNSARECAERIAARHPGESPAFVLQFDCAGRGKQLFGSRTADAIVKPLQNALGTSVPWLGFHSYGEIAPVAGRTFFHNFTVALCALFDSSGGHGT